MGTVARYPFTGFPYLNQGATTLKDGEVTVEEGRGGWIMRKCTLDGIPSVGCATRAVVASWLHMDPKHDYGIRRELARAMADR